MKKILIVILLIGFSAGVHAAEKEHPSLDQIVVNLSDGVDEFEAKKIGYEYFGRMGCGAVVILDAGDEWIAEGLFGYAAKSLGFIHIAKKDGAISKISPEAGRAEKLKLESQAQKLKAVYDF